MTGARGAMSSRSMPRSFMSISSSDSRLGGGTLRLGTAGGSLLPTMPTLRGCLGKGGGGIVIGGRVEIGTVGTVDTVGIGVGRSGERGVMATTAGARGAAVTTGVADTTGAAVITLGLAIGPARRRQPQKVI